MRIIILVLILFILSPGSYGLQLLDGLLEDALIFEASSPRLAGYLETERGTAGSAFRSNNMVNGRDININNSSLRFYSILPLAEKKSALIVSSENNNSHFSAVQDPAALDITGGSNLVSLFYAARLNDRLDVGLGVNQAKNEQENGRDLGFSYRIRFSPLQSLAIEYGAENSRLGNTATIGYGQDRFISPADGTQNMEMVAVNYKPADKFGFRGVLGKSGHEQSIGMNATDDRYTYARLDREAVYGSIGVEVNRDRLDLNFDLLASATDLNSSGGLFGFISPDLVLDGESIDKTADLAARVRAGGMRVGTERSVSDRLKFKADLSYLKLLFDGDAKTWNSWFFGMVRKLDSESALPVDSADVLAGGLGVKYMLNNNCEINYSFKQLIPIAVVKRESGANDSYSEINVGSAVSGGNTQTFAVAWYF